MEALKLWCLDSPYLTAILIYLLAEIAFKVINRILRTVKVLARGWPTNEYMDADGDIVLEDRP